MKFFLSITYVLKWELMDTPWYKFDANGNCINTKTGRIIKRVLNGRSVGYCINGRFRSLGSLRKMLRKIESIVYPF